MATQTSPLFDQACAIIQQSIIRLLMETRFNSRDSFSLTFAPFIKSRKYVPRYSTLNEEIKNDEILEGAWSYASEYSPDKSIGKIALYCYTLATDFYIEFNKSIRDWLTPGSSMTTFPYANYSMLLLGELKSYQELLIYRGDSYDVSLIGKKGDIVYANQFESHSKDISIAKGWVQTGTLYTTKTKKAVPILEYSAFPSEQECLIPPLAVFRITDVRPSGGQRLYNEVDLLWDGSYL